MFKKINGFLENNKDFGILIMRLAVGCAFVFVYGLMKIQGGTGLWNKLGGSMSNVGINFAPEFWGFMASVSEFGGGILIILGLFTRTSAFFMAMTMLMAAIQHLVKLDPWNKVIVPVELFSVFIALLFIGPGIYSLDYLFFKKNKSVKTHFFPN
ncbi:MAG: DoxX family protein [Ignavibacteria bacterium]|nr:DoxX family protein [Ignavibacteria bacterium]